MIDKGESMTTLRTSSAHAGHGRTRRRVPYRWLTATVGTAALLVGILVAAEPASATFSTWTAVSAGAAHTCGIKTDTTLWCWGANNVGQLGVGNTTDYPYPVAVQSGSTGWTAVSAGYDFTCAINAGYRECWGANGDGQLGLGDFDNHLIPTMYSGDGHHWIRIDAGQRHACGVNNDRLDLGLAVAFCWGSNLYGQLGTGDYTSYNVPTPVAITGHRWMQVSAGAYHTCAMDNTSYRYCWGRNDAHQLGMVSATTDDQLVPFHDAADGKYRYIDSGDGTTCVVTYTNRYLECYGTNTYGNIGNGNTTPTDDTVNYGQWVTTSSGGFHACGIDLNGTLYCWGLNDSGQLGLGDTFDRLIVTQLTQAPVTFSKVSAGLRHTCAIGTTSNLYCWGYNAQGQLGTGNTTNVKTPALVA
jgi:alpha-tubulin suppressor-like RCC1 family protein